MKTFFELREASRHTKSNDYETYTNPATGKVGVRKKVAATTTTTKHQPNDDHMAWKEKIAAKRQGRQYHESVNEKTLTPAEKKKREEVAKAIERENPNMPMAKKMAIATATAKKVAEAKEDISSYGNRRLASIANNQGHPDAAAAKNELARRRMQKEDVEQIDELSKKTLGSYVKGASASAAGIASGVGRDIGAGKKAHPDDTRQLRNRLKGVQKATDKLTNND